MRRLSQLNPEYLNLLNLADLLSKDIKIFEYAANRVNLSLVKDLDCILETYAKKWAAANPKGSFQLLDLYYQKMDLETLQKTIKKIPEIAGHVKTILTLFNKIWHEAHKFDDETDLKKRYHSWEQVYKWSNDYTKYFPGMRNRLRAKLLEDGLKCGIHDKPLFIEFLTNFYDKTVGLDMLGIDYANREKLDPRVSTSGFNVLPSYTHNGLDQNSLINEYMKVFLRTPKDAESFRGLISDQKMETTIYMSRLLSGEKDLSRPKSVSEGELEKIRTERRLKFTKSQPYQYNHGDIVTLTLEVKNIPEVQVNVYEINTVNYCKLEQKDFNDDLDLEGLVPKHTSMKNLGENPIISKEHSFEFAEEITKRGVFIVEFMGSGIISRAVIYIGSLSVVTIETARGINLVVVNEKKEICSGATTGLFIENKEFLVNAQGEVQMPFEVGSAKMHQAVVFHENFAQMVSFNVPAEILELNTKFLYNGENIRQGEVCTIMFWARLLVNKKYMSLAKVKDAQIELVITSENDISTTRNFKDIALKSGDDYAIKFLVPTKTRNLTLRFTGNTKKQEGGIQNFSAHESITFDRFGGESLRTFSIYLAYQQSPAGYVLRCLGKNGEAFPNEAATLNFRQKFLAQTPYNRSFTFDRDGNFFLGKLEEVQSLTVTSSTMGSSFQWTLADMFSEHFSHDYSLTTGQTLEIVNPVQGAGFQPERYILSRLGDDGSVISRHPKGLKVNDLGKLLVSPDGPGTWDLTVFTMDHQVLNYSVVVHEGSLWQNQQNYLSTQDGIFKMENSNRHELSLENVNVTAAAKETNQRTLSFNVNSNELSYTNVHVYVNNFRSEKIAKPMGDLRRNTPRSENQLFEIQRSSNSFLSEGKLHDEIKYVYDRRYREKFIGNTLEKPTMLLKRAFAKETVQDEEKLAKAQDFSSRDKVSMKKKMKMGLQSNEASYRSHQAMYAEPLRAGRVSRYADIEQGDTFLGHNALVLENLKPDSDGKITVTLPTWADEYSSVEILASNTNSFIAQSLNLDQDSSNLDKSKKDLKLKEVKAEGKVYVSDRKAHNLTTGESAEVEDLNGTEMMFVEDVSGLWDLLGLFSKYHNIQSGTLKEFEFMGNWSSLSVENKLKKYDKYGGHEFHMFLYFKDRKFFDNVVKKHLPSKREKEFVDHFVLENTKYFEELLSSGKLLAKSLHEQVLAFYALGNGLRGEQGSEKWNSMVAQMQTVLGSLNDKDRASNTDSKFEDRMFDTVLNAKAAEEPVAVSYAAPQESMAYASKSRGAPMR